MGIPCGAYCCARKEDWLVFILVDMVYPPGDTPILPSPLVETTYRSLNAYTSAPLAVACSGFRATRISDKLMGKSCSHSSFSKRSRNPGGSAVPPLRTSGMGR